MLFGVSSFQTGLSLGGLLDWLVPILMIWAGVVLIKKNFNKSTKITGALLASVGFFMVLWKLVWKIIAIFFIYYG